MEFFIQVPLGMFKNRNEETSFGVSHDKTSKGYGWMYKVFLPPAPPLPPLSVFLKAAYGIPNQFVIPDKKEQKFIKSFSNGDVNFIFNTPVIPYHDNQNGLFSELRILLGIPRDRIGEPPKRFQTLTKLGIVSGPPISATVTINPKSDE